MIHFFSLLIKPHLMQQTWLKSEHVLDFEKKMTSSDLCLTFDPEVINDFFIAHQATPYATNPVEIGACLEIVTLCGKKLNL
jgi:hypothetical protein